MTLKGITILRPYRLQHYHPLAWRLSTSWQTRTICGSTSEASISKGLTPPREQCRHEARRLIQCQNCKDFLPMSSKDIARPRFHQHHEPLPQTQPKGQPQALCEVKWRRGAINRDRISNTKLTTIPLLSPSDLAKLAQPTRAELQGHLTIP